MKVLVIGATGTIGKAVVNALVARHQVVSAGHRQGEFRVDLAELASIENLFGSVGHVDAVVSAAGAARSGPFADLTDQDFRVGLLNKLLGQINLTRVAAKVLPSGGSVTLAAGLASRHFAPGIVPVCVVNAGLEAFVQGARLEMPRGIRLNAVSPGWVLETRLAFGMDSSAGTPAAELALAYVRSVEGTETGTVFDVGRFRSCGSVWTNHHAIRRNRSLRLGQRARSDAVCPIRRHPRVRRHGGACISET